MSQPLNFKQGIYTLYECEEEHKEGKKYYWIVRGLNAFCWLNLFKNVYRFRPVRTILWGVPVALSQIAVNGFSEHFNQFVGKIDLREDGKTCDVTFISGKKVTYATTDFQTSNQSELVGNLNKIGLAGLDLFPLKVAGQQLMIDKTGRIEQ